MRVSDNTSASSVGEALRKTRGKMEKLQIQNATQKRIITAEQFEAILTNIPTRYRMMVLLAAETGVVARASAFATCSARA